MRQVRLGGLLAFHRQLKQEDFMKRLKRCNWEDSWVWKICCKDRGKITPENRYRYPLKRIN